MHLRHKWREIHRDAPWFSDYAHAWTTLVDEVCGCGKNRRRRAPATEQEILSVVAPERRLSGHREGVE